MSQALDPRKIHLWRKRLNIRLTDLAVYIGVDPRTLQAVENRKFHFEAHDICIDAEAALTYFDDTPLFKLSAWGQRDYKSTMGAIAAIQTLTACDTSIAYYQQQIDKARARVRIIDAMKFVKGPLENENLYVAKFEKGRSILIYGNLMRIHQHVQDYYAPSRKLVSIHPPKTIEGRHTLPKIDAA